MKGNKIAINELKKVKNLGFANPDLVSTCLSLLYLFIPLHEIAIVMRRLWFFSGFWSCFSSLTLGKSLRSTVGCMYVVLNALLID